MGSGSSKAEEPQSPTTEANPRAMRSAPVVFGHQRHTGKALVSSSVVRKGPDAGPASPTAAAPPAAASSARRGTSYAARTQRARIARLIAVTDDIDEDEAEALEDPFCAASDASGATPGNPSLEPAGSRRSASKDGHVSGEDSSGAFIARKSTSGPANGRLRQPQTAVAPGDDDDDLEDF